MAGPPRRAVKLSEPMARALAGKRWFPLWAVMHHRGRTSGTEYAVPVAVVPTVRADAFLVGLPWGPKTNWARNVVAADGATITWKGREHSLTDPRIIDAAEARGLTKPFLRPVIARFPAAIVFTRS